MAVESRICAVFGVPPLLVYAVIGLAYVNQRASAKEAHRDFWHNKMGPNFKRKRTWLEHTLLPEWEKKEDIVRRRCRLSWDMTEVAAMQEEVDTKLTRAREDFKAGAITLNQYLSQCGLPRDPSGDYYLRPINQIPVGADQVEQQQEAVLYATQQAVLLAMTYRREGDAAKDGKDEKESGGKSQPRPRKAKIDQLYKYVASGDENTCEACMKWDGKTGTKDELPAVPNPECGDGFGKCRCLHELVD